MYKTGIELIAQERQEQIEKHKWNDAEYVLGELVEGAEFALYPYRKDQRFPFQQKQFAVKIAEKSRIEQLAVAGAFIAAEIDRIQEETK